MNQRDTIAAIATASGKGGIGVLRISGAKAREIGERIGGQTLTPRYAHYCNFIDNQNKVIDEGIAIYFSAPNSFTGEDVVELQAHGSHILLDLLLNEALQQGARLARPGEFSERAYLNDKIDLVQAEAIADIIESSSVSASLSALKSLQGEFSNQINALVENITQLRIYVEAAIDFPEEEIDFVSDQQVSNSLSALIRSVETINQSAKRGCLLNSGLNVLILGKPNAGKSSLLNALAGRDQAIVTAQAGTTRDVLRETIEIDGLPLKIIDTAGLRASDDEIEQEGIRRAANESSMADIILYMQDISDDTVNPFPEKATLMAELAKHQIFLPQESLLVLINNKIDLTTSAPEIQHDGDYPIIWLSAKHQSGMKLLANYIKDYFGLSNTTENSFTARRRHLACLQRALQSLLKGQRQLQQHQAGELLAEDLRNAQDALGEITGKIIADELLGEIFSSFCIGK